MTNTLEKQEEDWQNAFVYSGLDKFTMINKTVAIFFQYTGYVCSLPIQHLLAQS